MSSGTSKITLLVTIFPLVAGAILTGIGIIDLNTANEAHEPKPNIAYGLLAFSSSQCSVSNCGIILQDVSLKEDIVNVKITCSLTLEATF